MADSLADILAHGATLSGCPLTRVPAPKSTILYCAARPSERCWVAATAAYCNSATAGDLSVLEDFDDLSSFDVRHRSRFSQSTYQVLVEVVKRRPTMVSDPGYHTVGGLARRVTTATLENATQDSTRLSNLGNAP